jgi:hypothetical protein
MCGIMAKRIGQVFMVEVLGLVIHRGEGRTSMDKKKKTLG